MTLLSDKCAVGHCNEQRVEGSIFCGSIGNGHLGDYWQGRLHKTADGTWIGTAGPARRPAWVERMAQNAKELAA